jgi:hypothetical protein
MLTYVRERFVQVETSVVSMTPKHAQQREHFVDFRLVCFSAVPVAAFSSVAAMRFSTDVLVLEMTVILEGSMLGELFIGTTLYTCMEMIHMEINKAIRNVHPPIRGCLREKSHYFMVPIFLGVGGGVQACYTFHSLCGTASEKHVYHRNRTFAAA